MTLVVLALAVARLTRLVTTDTLTEPVRNAILRRWPTEDTLFGDSEVEGGQLRSGVKVLRSDEGWIAATPNRWAELVSCSWCAGVWVGIIVWAAYWFYPVTEVLLTPLALSYAASFLIGRE